MLFIEKIKLDYYNFYAMLYKEKYRVTNLRPLGNMCESKYFFHHNFQVEWAQIKFKEYCSHELFLCNLLENELQILTD